MKFFCSLLLFTLTTYAQRPVADSAFVALSSYSGSFAYDMKYATPDNFLKTAVYDCPKCFLRLQTVKALIAANQEFRKKGYSIKLFDCYRPLSVQQKMWRIVSDPKYVADPAKGSIHNRGGAVDLTLVDEKGKELDMGTPFDFFGPQASHKFQDLPAEVKRNRRMLRRIMERHGFERFDSEWWHYNLTGSRQFPVADQKWPCP